MFNKIKPFVKMIINEPKISVNMMVQYLNNGYVCNTKFLDNDELFKEISKGRSIIRMGDGDMGIMHKKDIFHQVYEPELASLLRNIIDEYSDSSPYIFLVPKFLNMSNKELRTRGHLICWLPFKIEFMKNFNRSATYGDAHIFYSLPWVKKLFLETLKDKEVLVVSNKEIIERCKAKAEKNFTYYEIPSSGTSLMIDEIEKGIDSIITNNKNIKIVFSCGCSSRILAQRFSKKRVQSFDVGTGIACYLEDKDYSHVV